MKAHLPRLRQMQTGKPTDGKRRIVVFVHGIFSSFETFTYLIAEFAGDTRFNGYDLASYDYDWGQPIETSGEQLRDILNGRIPNDAEVTLVGHSMGGLVSRFALIGGELPCVRRIFMLGTPNFGAMTAAQVNILWQLAIGGAGKLMPFFPRKAGLRDLTRVQTLYNEAIKKAEFRACRARNVDYVTVPGLFYNRDRRDTDPGEQGEAIPFTIGTLAIRVLANVPLSGIEIERPHDGVVEERSVCMMNGPSDMQSEKSGAIGDAKKFGVTYCHAVPDTAVDDTHMSIQDDPRVAGIVKELILADSIVAWHDALNLDQLERMKVIRPTI